MTSIYLGLLIFFVVSNQPFQMSITMILLVISMLNMIYFVFYAFYFCYILMMVYLGGLLILFVYLTSTMQAFNKTKLFFVFLLIFVIFLKDTEVFQNHTTNKTNSLSLLFFSFQEGVVYLMYIFFLLCVILYLMGYFSVLVSPLRQQ